jgi:hypothetical protein
MWERVFVTSEGHPGARLQRAVAAGNLVDVAQVAALLAERDLMMRGL